MANSFSAISTAGIYKNYYQGPIVDQLSEDIPVYRGAEKVKNAYSGQQVNRPLRVRRNQGIGASSDGGSLPVIGNQTTVQAVIESKYLYLRAGMTGPAIKASKNDQGSFARIVGYNIEMGWTLRPLLK